MKEDKKNKDEKKEEELAECYCPLIKESDWDEKELNWTGKQFLKVFVKNWFYKPKEDYSTKILDGYKTIARRGYGNINFGLMLFQPGRFKEEILLEIKKGEINDPQVKTFMGNIYTKVFIGNTKDLSLVEETFDFRPLNIYYFYCSCPVCEPDPEKQKTILIAEKKFY